MMELDLKNRVAVVTGAGRGIGEAIALALARAGAHVVLAARREADLAAVAKRVQEAGGEASWCVTDVGSGEDVEALFKTVDAGPGRLDILVNNAGLGEYGPLHEFTPDQFDRVIRTNLRGTFFCCREAMQRMIPKGAGYIINVSSVVGFKGYPLQSAYAASKHGIMGLTKSLAVEAQEHGIKVSAVLPGGVDTDMVRQARPDLDPDELLQPEDIAQTVCYLLSLSPQAAIDQIYVRRRNSTPFP